MRVALNIVGVLCFLIGAIWILQGLDVLTQGTMAGHRGYAVLGLAVVAVGVVLLVVANRRKKAA